MNDLAPLPADWQFELTEHEGKSVILIRFKYNTEHYRLIRSMTGAHWSRTQKAWYVLDTPMYRQRFGLKTEPVGKEVLLQIHEVNRPALLRFIETLELKAYSPSTIRTYRNEFAQFLYILKDKPAADLSPKRLRDYFLYCTNTLKLAENTLHSRMNALKFYFEQVLKRERMFFEIPRPKKKLTLPNVLAISQVERLFSQLENLKHKTMIYLAYSAGLRVSEVVNLRIKDIHSERMVINIRGAKGKKDRMVGLSQGILELLRKYYVTYKPKDWLFDGNMRANHIAQGVYKASFIALKKLLKYVKM
jgi:integrase/recombinase XerD